MQFLRLLNRQRDESKGLLMENEGAYLEHNRVIYSKVFLNIFPKWKKGKDIAAKEFFQRLTKGIYIPY